MGLSEDTNGCIRVS